VSLDCIVKGELQNIHRDLIINCQQGDSQSYEQIYKLYAKAMFNICRRYMGDEEEARDILQESFIDAFRKLPQLREVNTFSLWLKRIVTNNCINALRKKRLLTEELNEKVDVIEEVDDFEYTNHKASRIMDAIDLLPDGCKTVLSLYLFEGYDHKEISQILSISESASKAQFCKAKARIREQLENRNMQQYV